MSVCIAGATYTIPVSFPTQANANYMQANPTIAAADFRISVNGGALAALDNLPTVTPAASKLVEIVVSAAETTAAAAGGYFSIICSDSAGAEWRDVVIHVRVFNDDIDATATWTYTPRTLTTASSPVTVLTGTDLTITRGDTLNLDIAGLGDISGRTRLWFTVRGALDQPDTASIIQIDEATGLIVLNGVTVPAARNANGSITVTDAVAGDITIALAAVESDDLVIQGGLSYDVQFLSAAGVQTLTLAQVRVGADVTRSITLT